MNLQLVFDTVKAHLLEQNVKAGVQDMETGEFSCRYLDDDGNRCAIGCILDPEIDYAELENLTIHNGYVQDAIDPKFGFKGGRRDVGFLSELQNLHDMKMPKQWEGSLKSFAERNNLKS